jgi:streptogramin lyase
MVAADGSLWVSGDRSVVEIDPVTNTIKSRVAVPGIGPWGLSASGDELWAALNTEGKIARIDLRTRRVRLTRVGKSPYTVLANDRGVWVANYKSRSVSRLDPRTGGVLATARLDGEPYRMEFERSL